MSLTQHVPDVTEIDKLLLKHTELIHKAILDAQQKPAYQTMTISAQIDVVQLGIYARLCAAVSDTIKLVKEPA